MDNILFLDPSDSESPASKSTHSSPDPSGISGHLSCPVSEYFPASQIFDLSSNGQEFKNPFITPPRAEHTASPDLSPKSSPELGKIRAAKKALETVNKTFLDVQLSDEEPSSSESFSYGCVAQNLPVIRTGSQDASSQTAIASPIEDDGISSPAPTSREEAFHTAASSFFSPIDVPYLVFSQKSSAYRLIDNDSHPTKAGPRVQDFFPHPPTTRCHCHWCVLYRRTGGIRGKHEMNVWCYCFVCVAVRVRRTEIRRRVTEEAEKGKGNKGAEKRRDDKGGCSCCGELWGLVRSCLRDGE